MSELRQYESQALTVSKFVSLTDKAIKTFGFMLVCGEISQFKGVHHLYFTIKDEQASVDCVMFNSRANKLNFTPRVGQTVLIKGECSLYSKTGKFSLNVSQMELTGLGQIMAQLAQLEQRLRFERVIPKRPLPKPDTFSKVVIITSQQGTVKYDMATNIWRRYPEVELFFIGTKVQGPDAPAYIVDALYKAYNLAYREHCDAIILARGGGSFEDLLCFSDEQVVRTVAQSPVFLISAIGHDADHPLCDLAADVFVSTPTAAAEFVTPVTVDMLNQRFNQLIERANDVMLSKLDEAQTQCESLIERLFNERTMQPVTNKLQMYKLQLQSEVKSMDMLVKSRLNQAQQRYAVASQALKNQTLEHKLDSLNQRLSNQTLHLSTLMQERIHQTEDEFNKLEKRLNALDIKERLAVFDNRLQQIFVKLDLDPAHPKLLPRNFAELTQNAPAILERQLSRLDQLAEKRINKPLNKLKNKFMRDTTRLEVLNPVAQLQHGLTLTTVDGQTPVDDSSLEVGQDIITLTKQSRIHSTVSKIEAFDPVNELLQSLPEGERQNFTAFKQDKQEFLDLEDELNFDVAAKVAGKANVLVCAQELESAWAAKAQDALNHQTSAEAAAVAAVTPTQNAQATHLQDEPAVQPQDEQAVQTQAAQSASQSSSAAILVSGAPQDLLKSDAYEALDVSSVPGLSGTESGVESDAESVAESEAENDDEAGTESGFEPDVESVAESDDGDESVTETASESQAGDETEVNSDAQSKVEANQVIEPVSNSSVESEGKPEGEAESQAKTESESQAKS